jgi:serine/threonine protein phosphatase PrpC
MNLPVFKVTRYKKKKMKKKKGVPQSFFGVYDGHSGNGAAEYARMHVHLNLAGNANLNENVFEAMRESFLKTV